MREGIPKAVRRRTLFLLLLLLSLPPAAWAQERVLLLHSYHQGHLWSDAVTESFVEAVTESGREISLVINYLDLMRAPHLFRQNLFFDYMRSRYEGEGFDLIVAVGDDALEFSLRYRKDLFPEAPVVFCGVKNPRLIFQEPPPGVTGTISDDDLEETINVALRLHPKAVAVAAVSDLSDFGRAAVNRLHDIETRFAWQADCLPLVNLPHEELRWAVEALPKEAVLLYLSYAADAEILSKIARWRPDLPVYTPWAPLIEAGAAVGGYVILPEEEGRYAAESALRILGGVAPQSLPVRWSSPKVHLFHRRGLARFGLTAKDLPRGSLVVDDAAADRSRSLLVPGALLSVLAVLIALSVIVRRNRSEESLEEQRRFLGLFIEMLPLPVFYRDESRRYLNANRAFVELAGVERERLLGRTPEEILPRDWAERAREADLKEADGADDDSCSYEMSFVDFQGRPRYVLVARRPHRDRSGRLRGLIGVIVDLSDHKEREETLRRQEERLQKALEGAAEGVWDWDVPTGRLAFRMEGLDCVIGDQEEMSLDDWRRRLYPEDLAAFDRALKDHLEGRSGVFSCECRLRTPAGRWVWILVRGRIVACDEKGAPLRLAGTLQDIGESKEIEARRRETERELRREAMTDRLTGVLNRKYFEDLLALQVRRSSRDGSPLSLILFDLDDFKAVNDRHGHIAGDRVLSSVCDLVRAHIRAQDYFGRWGGEEFSLLILGPVDGAVQVSEKLRNLIEEEDFRIEGRLTASFGVAVYQEGDTVASLVARVDEALYRAKRSGKNQVHV